MTPAQFFRNLKLRRESREIDAIDAVSVFVTPRSPLNLPSLSGRIFGTIGAVGNLTMKAGRTMARLGFRLTMIGFGMWLVSGIAQYLLGPVAQLAVSEIAADIPDAPA